MTILQALDRYYDRMAAREDTEAPGYSREKISFAIVLSADGSRSQSWICARPPARRKAAAPARNVLQRVKRTAGICRTSSGTKPLMSSGVTARRRQADRRATTLPSRRRTSGCSMVRHRRRAGRAAPLPGSLDPAAGRHAPLQSGAYSPPISSSGCDGEHSFASIGACGAAACRAPVSAPKRSDAKGFCLVTGEHAADRAAASHDQGRRRRQSSGASAGILQCGCLHILRQGAGRQCAYLGGGGVPLRRGAQRIARPRRPQPHRPPIGDATRGLLGRRIYAEELPEAAEDVFALASSAKRHRRRRRHQQAAKCATRSTTRRRPPGPGSRSRAAAGVPFHVLGLAPNAARLSVRYWLDDDFEAFADAWPTRATSPSSPRPGGGQPAVQRLLVKTTRAPGEIRQHPAAAGRRGDARGAERAPLSPHAADRGHHPPPRRRRSRDAAGMPPPSRPASVDRQEETPPMALEPENPNAAYQLGRLFAVLGIRPVCGTRPRERLHRRSLLRRGFGDAGAGIRPLLRGLRTSRLGRPEAGARRLDRAGRWARSSARLPPELPRTLRAGGPRAFRHRLLPRTRITPVRARTKSRPERPEEASQ